MNKLTSGGSIDRDSLDQLWADVLRKIPEQECDARESLRDLRERFSHVDFNQPEDKWGPAAAIFHRGPEDVAKRLIEGGYSSFDPPPKSHQQQYRNDFLKVTQEPPEVFPEVD
jgi:hypothetical protein